MLESRIGYFNIRANNWLDVQEFLDSVTPGRWQVSHYALDRGVAGEAKRNGFQKFAKTYRVITEERAAASLKLFLEHDPRSARDVCLHHSSYLVADKRLRERANRTGNGHRAGLGLFFSWEAPFFTPEARALFAEMRSLLRPFLVPSHGEWGRRWHSIIACELEPVGAVERATYYSPCGWVPSPHIRADVRTALLLEGEQ